VEKFEFTYFRKDGTQRLGEAHICFMEKDGKKVGLQAILRDVTEVKNAIRESFEQARNLSLLLDSSLLGITHYDLQGKIILINRKACERMKGNPALFIGKNLEAIYGKKIGAIIKERLKEAKRTGENKVYENEEDTAAGKKWYRSIYNRIVDEGGVMVGLQIVSDDITEEKVTEQALRRTSEELRIDSDKLRLLNENLEVVGKLTRHDIRNKLAGIKGYAYLLKKRLGDKPELLSYLEQIDASIESAERLLNFTNVYEKIGSDQLTLH
jgi:PAS domain S-box-containing protein